MLKQSHVGCPALDWYHMPRKVLLGRNSPVGAAPERGFFPSFAEKPGSLSLSHLVSPKLVLDDFPPKIQVNHQNNSQNVTLVFPARIGTPQKHRHFGFTKATRAESTSLQEAEQRLNSFGGLVTNKARLRPSPPLDHLGVAHKKRARVGRVRFFFFFFPFRGGNTCVEPLGSCGCGSFFLFLCWGYAGESLWFSFTKVPVW